MKRSAMQISVILFTVVIMLLYQNCGGLGSAVRLVGQPSSPKKDGGPAAPDANLEIIKHPHSKTAYIGDTITFEAVAKSSDGLDLAYQWKKNGEVLDEETGPSLVLTGVAAADTGLYSVEISTVGEITETGFNNRTLESQTAPLVVSDTTLDEVFPQIVRQSRSANIATGSPVVLELDVFGKPQPSVQWYKDGTLIEGATADFLIVEESQSTDGGIYRAEVSNLAGIKRSAPILISLDQAEVAPIFVDKTPDQSVGLSQKVFLEVAATGLPEPTYQWLKDGVVINGATNPVYMINSTTVADSAVYAVVVNNPFGNFIENIQLTVVDNITITAAPANQLVAVGDPVSFNVTVEGVVDSYQWFKDDVIIDGATAPTFSIGAVQTTDAGTYKVRMTNISGSVDASATLTVATAPQIVMGPQNSTVTAGDMATFNVMASGLALTYQWFKEGTALGGQTNATLNIANAQTADAGSYSVTVTNIAGSVSATATLTVNPLVIDGAQVYANNCASCHGALADSTKKMRTAMQIDNAIATQPAMMGLMLSADELQALEEALDIM